MGRLKTSHWVEAILWLLLAAFLYYHSIGFNQPIEIYKYGAAAWPRALILMVVIVAIGQLLYNLRTGGERKDTQLESIMVDEAENQASLTGLGWYLSTFFMLSLPFIYMNLPGLLVETDKPNDPALHKMKLICAAGVIVVYLIMMSRNKVGGIMTLPLLFSSMLQDFGFYALAPVFVVGVMFLMGERRLTPYLWVMPLIIGILLLFFVSLLYVGLPTGNISPFYDLGTKIVEILQ